MSLPVLVVMVVVGIAAIVLSVHLTGGTRNAVLPDAEAARQRFATDFPGEKTGAVVLSSDRGTAFLELSGDRTGIVQAFGGHFLTRIVTPADILRVEPAGSAALHLTLNDYTWRGGRFEFADQGETWRLAGRLAPKDSQEARRSA
ncbi:hypothetical protein ABGN05_13070 [Aquibium sp. LZ166]|uniref:Uncharacterized protein n=1 Tax=Aquibium pacificus TaxID=3153579 RepID=A0ABV3SIN8_9HYPH